MNRFEISVSDKFLNGLVNDVIEFNNLERFPQKAFTKEVKGALREAFVKGFQKYLKQEGPYFFDNYVTYLDEGLEPLLPKAMFKELQKTKQEIKKKFVRVTCLVEECDLSVLRDFVSDLEVQE